MPSQCLNNIFEFRVLNNPSVQFLCTAQGAIMINLNNESVRTIASSARYYRFYYTYINDKYTYILLQG